MAKNQFPHLRLLLRTQGRASLTGGGKKSDETKANLNDRAGHGGRIRASGQFLSTFWKDRLADRETHGLPDLPKGVPLLLQIDPNVELDFLRSAFGFEIVAEQPDGFVIVVSEDVELKAFLDKINDFIADKDRTGGVAQVHRLFDDADQDSRLQRILSERLYELWPTLDDRKTYIFDIGIESYGNAHLPELVRDADDTDEKWQRRVDRWLPKREQAQQNASVDKLNAGTAVLS